MQRTQIKGGWSGGVEPCVPSLSTLTEVELEPCVRCILFGCMYWYCTFGCMLHVCIVIIGRVCLVVRMSIFGCMY